MLKFAQRPRQVALQVKGAMIIQIYEVQEPDEAGELIRLGVDHVGGVLLAADQWRRPDIRATFRTVRKAGAVSSLIPLFGDRERVLQALDYHRPDIVHFCDDLPHPDDDREALAKMIALQRAVRRAFPGIRIMRSLPIGLPGQAARCPTLALAHIFEPESDLFLTDTRITAAGGAEQPVNGFIGITGRTCDWPMARELVARSRIPVILAGGLGPENVAEAISAVRPWGVDSCTGTNRVDEQGRPVRFRKDLRRVARFVAESRRAAQEREPNGGAGR